jgi:hypothetical protein
MDIKAHPRPFPEWCAGRDEALATLPADAPPEARAAVEKAVDTALHNVNDLLEGFWKLDAGPAHTVELALAVRVYDSTGNLVETQEISPSKLDLPMGYWGWAKRRAFR